MLRLKFVNFEEFNRWYVLLLSLRDVYSDKSEFDVCSHCFLFSLYLCSVILWTEFIQLNFILIILE